MTLVAALSGCDGTILLADTEEVVSSYSTRTVDKLAVWDCQAFRLGIAGASTDGTYADMLQSEILGALSRLPAFDMGSIKTTLSDTLTSFYAKHIWPRTGDRPQMEYLLVVQPHPRGRAEIIHISETAANIVAGESKTVGVGAYLADYILKQIFSAPVPVNRTESTSQLCAAGLYVAKEVRENIDGVGPVDRVAVFDSNGGYDELYPVDIAEIEENVSAIWEFHMYFFTDIFDAERDEMIMGDADGFIRDMKERHKEWYKKWNDRRAARERLRQYPNPNRRTAS